MRIYKCWFCSANIYPGHGTTFVRSDCTVFRFCRPKCFKLFKKRLNPRKIKWTKISRKLRNKEMATDPIMQFERRVDVPAMYSREVLMNTIEAIPKIAEVKMMRGDVFIADRILSKQEENVQRELEFIERHKRLLKTAEKDEKTSKKETKKAVEYV